ncbi:Erg29p PWA37_004123 [Arxiozyma heterogenica]|uniref:Uncharacterized protein n=1 Tax=Arxiozyma heterogenica TaxID=278026 RepID=A0AAN7WPR1_9SACH|nr:hypothetical protein RI543_003145 [Kazachstania heterogenica]
MTEVLNRWLEIEDKLLNILHKYEITNQFMHDKLSSRITLYLIIIGLIAFLNELYISIDMIFIQKQTYNELNEGSITEGLKLRKVLINDPTYHSKEYMDQVNGIIIEEFEDWDKFCSKPVHVSQLFVECNIIKDGKTLLFKPIKYHIEFLPEEFDDEKRTEFGCSLHVLRVKLYHLFKDSDWYNELVDSDDKKFTISENVKVYNTQNELLPVEYDDIQLCFLKMETNNTIKCEFVL